MKNYLGADRTSHLHSFSLNLYIPLSPTNQAHVDTYINWLNWLHEYPSKCVDIDKMKSASNVDNWKINTKFNGQNNNWAI